MITVVGLSHHTATLDVREKVALNDEEARRLVIQLHEHPDVSEVFAISTCNRVEVIAKAGEDSEQGGQRCASACRQALTNRCPEATTALYSHRGIAAVRHTVRVASSLDSLVVGEAQILGQMKKGYESARQLATVGPGLSRLFSSATRGAKRVRSETGIGVGQVSVPSIAVDLASQIFGDLEGRSAILVGAGEMGQTVARLLHDAGADLTVVGRRLERVTEVADRVRGSARLMSDLPGLLLGADVVVSSTSASGHVLGHSELELRKRSRNANHLFLIDLAVPRDIDPRVSEMDSVFLYDVDDLSQVAHESTGLRKKEAESASVIVEQVVVDWERRSLTEQVTPTIKALRAKLRLGLEAELAKSLRGKLKDLDEEQRVALVKMLDAGINRILHEPVTALREEAGRAEQDLAASTAAVVTELFSLQGVASGALEAKGVRLPEDLEPPPKSGSERRRDSTRVGETPVGSLPTNESEIPSAK